MFHRTRHQTCKILLLNTKPHHEAHLFTREKREGGGTLIVLHFEISSS